jgi:hypothetical protein
MSANLRGIRSVNDRNNNNSDGDISEVPEALPSELIIDLSGEPGTSINTKQQQQQQEVDTQEEEEEEEEESTSTKKVRLTTTMSTTPVHQDVDESGMTIIDIPNPSASSAACSIYTQLSSPQQQQQHRFVNSGQKVSRVWKLGRLTLRTGLVDCQPLMRLSREDEFGRCVESIFITGSEYFHLRAGLAVMLSAPDSDYPLSADGAPAAMVHVKDNEVRIVARYLSVDDEVSLTITKQEFAAFDKALNVFWYTMKQYHNNSEATSLIHKIYEMSALAMVESLLRQLKHLPSLPNSKDPRYLTAFFNAYMEMNNFNFSTELIQKVNLANPTLSVKMDIFTLFHQCITHVRVLQEFVQARIIELKRMGSIK